MNEPIMTPEATCTRIRQNGLTYNTRTAVKMKTRVFDEGPHYPGYSIQTLYRKNIGVYFVHVQPMVKAGQGRDADGRPIHYITPADEPCVDYIKPLELDELMANWLTPKK